MILTHLTADHYAAVNAIYLEGIATGNATFQTEGKTWDEWDAGHLQHCRLVALDGDTVLGWAALSPVSSRCVYAGVAEVSVYVSNAAKGHGVGTALMQRLVADSETAGLWTLQAGIFPENTASLALHQRAGFRIVGHRERIGQMHTGEWRDNLLLERRSKTIGIKP